VDGVVLGCPVDEGVLLDGGTEVLGTLDAGVVVGAFDDGLEGWVVAVGAVTEV
jgi:hypothetical protein